MTHTSVSPEAMPVSCVAEWTSSASKPFAPAWRWPRCLWAGGAPAGPKASVVPTRRAASPLERPRRG